MVDTVRLLSVDPGLRRCGVALFDGRVLLRAGLAVGQLNTQEGSDLEAVQKVVASVIAWVEGAEDEHGAKGIDGVIIERPQIYTHTQGRKDPNDLIPLAAVGGALAYAYPFDHRWVLPHTWKGSIDADLMTVRIRERLTPDEFAAVELPKNTCPDCVRRLPKSTCTKSSCLAHNVFDAVGIGLWSLGRLERHRVFPR